LRLHGLSGQLLKEYQPVPVLLHTFAVPGIRSIWKEGPGFFFVYRQPAVLLIFPVMPVLQNVPFLLFVFQFQPGEY
jgi:hypothetical protein